MGANPPSVPDQQAVDKAYAYFGLSQSCSNKDINRRYNKLFFLYHPENEGGSIDKINELGYHLAILKAVRHDLM